MRTGQARKRDANEPAIVAALERVGAGVVRINAVGMADLLVLWRGDLFLMEIKQRRGRVTKAQALFAQQGWPAWLVRSPEDALRVIGVELS